MSTEGRIVTADAQDSDAGSLDFAKQPGFARAWNVPADVSDGLPFERHSA
jgi:hypothetical protein